MMPEMLGKWSSVAQVLSPIFYKLVFLSLTAALAGWVILVIRKIWDKKIPPIWKYLMWSVVLLGLLIPWRPQSRISLVGKLEPVAEISYREAYETARYDAVQATQQEKEQLAQEQAELPSEQTEENPIPAEPEPMGPVVQEPTVPQTEVEKTDPVAVPDPATQSAVSKAKKVYWKSLLVDEILPLCWGLGAAVALLCLWIGQVLLNRRIRKTGVKTDLFAEQMSECCKRLGMRRSVPVLVSDEATTPAIVGVLHPCVLMPAYTQEMEPNTLRYILMHELGHYKRKDLWINQLLLLLQCIYWFNPLLWPLFRAMREDMEVLNDSYILQKLREPESRDYARSLVAVLGKSNNVAFPSRLVTLTDGAENVERRIHMMKASAFFQKYRWVLGAGCVVCILALAGLFLTDRSLGEAEAVKQLVDSIRCEEDVIRFVVPKRYAEADQWNIQVSGRAFTEANGYQEISDSFAEQNEAHSWQKGEEYRISARGQDYKELQMQVQLPGDVSQEVDLLEYVRKARNTRALTPEELEQVNAAFAPIPMEGTVWNQNPAAYLVEQSFVDPERLDVRKLIEDVYIEGMMQPYPGKEEARGRAIEIGIFPGLQNPSAVYWKPKGVVDRILNQYLGITTSQLNLSQVYWNEQPDGNFCVSMEDVDCGESFVCSYGEIGEDTATLYGGTSIMTLKKQQDRWVISSHIRQKEPVRPHIEDTTARIVRSYLTMQDQRQIIFADHYLCSDGTWRMPDAENSKVLDGPAYQKMQEVSGYSTRYGRNVTYRVLTNTEDVSFAEVDTLEGVGSDSERFVRVAVYDQQPDASSPYPNDAVQAAVQAFLTEQGKALFGHKPEDFWIDSLYYNTFSAADANETLAICRVKQGAAKAGTPSAVAVLLDTDTMQVLSYQGCPAAQVQVVCLPTETGEKRVLFLGQNGSEEQPDSQLALYAVGRDTWQELSAPMEAVQPSANVWYTMKDDVLQAVTPGAESAMSQGWKWDPKQEAFQPITPMLDYAAVRTKLAGHWLDEGGSILDIFPDQPFCRLGQLASEYRDYQVQSVQDDPYNQRVTLELYAPGDEMEGEEDFVCELDYGDLSHGILRKKTEALGIQCYRKLTDQEFRDSREQWDWQDPQKWCSGAWNYETVCRNKEVPGEWSSEADWQALQEINDCYRAAYALGVVTAYSRNDIGRFGVKEYLADVTLPQVVFAEGKAEPYRIAEGRYHTWADLEEDLLRYFTPDYVEKLLDTETANFMEKDGALCYRESSDSSLYQHGWDENVLISETENEIVFQVLSYRYPEPTKKQVLAHSNIVRMVKTEQSWRVAEFTAA